MKSKIGLLSLLLLTLTSLQGCVIAVGGESWDRDDDDSWRKQEEANKKLINLLELGQTESAVTEKMGQPDISEAFSRSGESYKVFYYRTQQVHSDSRTTKNETTPLVFSNGVLVGWGESALDQTKPAE